MAAVVPESDKTGNGSLGYTCLNSGSDGGSMTTDIFDLRRFLTAQDSCYPTALSELRAGAKQSHWMWFIFPQVAGLGLSSTARHYAVSGLEEAQLYLAHPMLGQRLVECTEAVLKVEGRSARQIFGGIDEMKFRSCMTLFAEVSPCHSLYHQALDRYFPGGPDVRTLELLESM